LLGLYLADTYRLEIQIAGLWAPARVLLSLAVTLSVTSSLIYLAGWWGEEPLAGRGILLLTILFFAFWSVSSRLLSAKWVKDTLAQGRWLVIGSLEKGKQLERDYRLLSPRTEFIFGDRSDDIEPLSYEPWSGVLIEDHIQKLPDPTVRCLIEMRLQGTYIYKFSEFYEQFWRKIPPLLIQEDWFAFTSGFSILHNRINVKIKRLIDISGSGLILIVMLPLMLLVALAIKLDSPGSIFYHQVRTGLEGHKFRVHKFRSMCQDAEKRGAQWASNGDSRITRVGKIIRLIRIDELPQLWNVLKGDMSLIGPRPERPEFDQQLRQEIPYYDIRYLVRPGITGWAQVNYPYGASVEDAYQKVAYDLYYIKNYSLLLDVAIVLKTIRVIFLGQGR
jgi:exopolysaccharide biosynthesis polyprenyl glycosylphosphotransferase